ncbi:hypothetical protein C8R43DRAFT_15141, partial [Mycena crocata]
VLNWSLLHVATPSLKNHCGIVESFQILVLLLCHPSFPNQKITSQVTMSDADIVEVSDRETSFSSHESDAEHLYDAIEILKEKKGQYLIKWDGVDPATGKPWPDSWANKRDCTDDIVATWKLKKAQKKKEQQERKAKKVAKTRASTVSRRTQASKASTSRQTASLAPSSRSLRSRTAVPGDYEEQYESISRTPGKRRAVASLSDDDAPPPSARPAKKRKLLPPERRSRSPVELVADSSDDDEPSNGKGKAVARLSKSATPLPRKPGRPPKNVSLLQRQRDKGDDDFGDKTPAKPSRGTSLVQRRNDKQDDRSADDPSTKPRKSIIQRQRDKQDHSFFDDIPAKPPQSASLFRSQREKKDDNWGEPPKSTSRQRYKTPDSEHSDAAVHQPTKFPHPSTPTRRRSSFDRHISQSQILSPNGQARLAQFDDEIANPTQQPQFSSEKQPLFLPGSSEEPTLPPSRSHSPQQPKSPQYHPSPPQPESPQYRDSPSPSRSRSLSPGPRIPSPVAPSPPPRTINPRHASRRPADDSYRDGDIPETQSPPTSPAVALPSPKRSLISKAMKPRSKTSSFYGPQSPRTTKPVGPITLMTAAQFTAQVQKDTVGDGEASLPSSIEQFSSPAKKQKGPSRVVDKKGKGRQLDEEDENEETDVLRERMIALADKARAERRAQLAEYAGTEPKEKTTLSQILKQRAQEGPSLSQTDSDIAMSQPQAVVDAPVQPERREEEENTQDVMAYYNIVTDPPNGVVDHSDVLQAMNGVAEDRPHSESDARGRSVDRETDAEGSLDVDIAERSAWNKEHASQQHLFEQNGDTSLEHAGDTSQDRMRDDSMDLLYPPDDDPVSEEPLASERIPAEEPPPAPNGYAAQPQSRSKSRSTSARPKKSLDDADLELPPTASTNENSPERGKNGLEPGEIPEVIRVRPFCFMSLL